MRPFLYGAVPLAVVSLGIGSVALGQGERREDPASDNRARQAGHAAIMLINLEKVQKDLEMTEAQIGTSRKLEDDVLAGFRFGLTLEEREKYRAETVKKDAELKEKVKELLTPKQSLRLRQIQLWMGGAWVLIDDADAANAVKLTDSQRDRLKAIAAETRRKQSELVKSARAAAQAERAKIREQMDALGNESETACRGVLTDEQKVRFDELRGPQFEFTREDELRAQQESRARRLGRK